MEKSIYIAIVEQYDKQLVKSVNEKIKDGYKPHGNIVVSFDKTGVIKSYVQVMMLQEE
ncbi:DUF1737 domain-containing protein [Candidatus Halobeggiatoa sp. HSG11]|nr:DUF1737 domain-containing protein [Candidatus Halobeggiatoa sp. HSG11]